MGVRFEGEVRYGTKQNREETPALHGQGHC